MSSAIQHNQTSVDITQTAQIELEPLGEGALAAELCGGEALAEVLSSCSLLIETSAFQFAGVVTPTTVSELLNISVALSDIAQSMSARIFTAGSTYPT
ncbi:MAG: hypothetical protein AAGI92_01355 [Pseudomonadota bacterium]